MNSAAPPVASLDLIVPVTIALSTVVQVELRIHLICVPSKHSESKSSTAAGSDCVIMVGRHTNVEFIWIFMGDASFIKVIEMNLVLNICTPWATLNVYCILCVLNCVMPAIHAIVRVQMNCAMMQLPICSWFAKGIMLIRYFCLQTCPQNCWSQFAQEKKKKKAAVTVATITIQCT